MATNSSLTSGDPKPGKLPPIRFPGNFIVSQGIAGDGLINTLEEPHALSREISKRGGLKRAPYDLRRAPRNVRQELGGWKRLHKKNATDAWKGWADETAISTRSLEDQDFYQVVTYQNGEPMWWIDEETGHLASFKTIPDLSKKTFEQNGCVPPGTIIYGQELYHVKNPAIPRDYNASVDKNVTTRLLPDCCIKTNRNKLFPWNRSVNVAGEILVMRYKSQQNEGYCIYGIDGSPFVYPASLHNYAGVYADPESWYWKVTRATGVTIGCTLVPYGSLVEVKERVRTHHTWIYWVSAYLWTGSARGRGYSKVEDWFEEPLDSQALFPLPLARPVVYRIVLPDGAKIWSTERNKERFFGRKNGTLTITKRVFLDRKVNANSTERLYAAGCGWVSGKCRKGYWKGSHIVEPIAISSDFDPQAPEVFHYTHVRAYLLRELLDENDNPSMDEFYSSRLYRRDPSEIEEEEISDGINSAVLSSIQDVPSDETNTDPDEAKSDQDDENISQVASTSIHDNDTIVNYDGTAPGDPILPTNTTMEDDVGHDSHGGAHHPIDCLMCQ